MSTQYNVCISYSHIWVHKSYIPVLCGFMFSRTKQTLRKGVIMTAASAHMSNGKLAQPMAIQVNATSTTI